MTKIFNVLILMLTVIAIACSGCGASQKKASASNSAEVQTKANAERTVNIKVSADVLTLTLADNTSANALYELLKSGPITIGMRDFSNFEKAGSLPKSLPTNDEMIHTQPGDVILYQGKTFVIYYDQNSWELTRLGKIKGATREQLLKLLGDGDVTVELSL